MAQPETHRRRLSSFSVLLIMVTLMGVGACMIPLLNLQNRPQKKSTELSVWVSWQGASAQLIEREVTSKLEGSFARIRGIEWMYSNSYQGSASITLQCKKEVSVEAFRFELATLIRQIYPNLPQGVSYPTIGGNARGETEHSILSYTLLADLPRHQIQQYAEKHLSSPLSSLKGVGNVQVSAATPFQWEVSFDPDKAIRYGVSHADMAGAMRLLDARSILGSAVAADSNRYMVLLANGFTSFEEWESIPVKTVNNRIIYLGQLASVSLREQLPQSYHRVNGLNNIYINVYAEKSVNTLKVAKAVKEKMALLKEDLPPGFAIQQGYDASVHLKKELTRNFTRVSLSVVILLLFVFLVSRSGRYLWMIFVTLLANVLLSFILYVLFDLDIHLFSLAGITVSLGMLIDSSIIMIDHYGRYRDYRAFIGILAALLTTIGALSIIFFLPEDQRLELLDFAAVIIINLTVSLLVALFCIPALLETWPLKQRIRRRRLAEKRLVVGFSHRYSRLILFEKRHKALFILIAVLAFGIPVQKLPHSFSPRYVNGKAQELSFLQQMYNKTLGSSIYLEQLKPWVDKGLGGSFRLFSQTSGGFGFQSESGETRLYINGSMPTGCTVQQMNETIKKVENFLSQYPEIDRYETKVNSGPSGSIEVTFKPEHARSGFPYFLRDAVLTKVINLGGAEWEVYGVGEGFNNRLNDTYFSVTITLQGYNYERLYRYAEEMADTLRKVSRVKSIGIIDGKYRVMNKRQSSEFFISFNRESMAFYQWNLGTYTGRMHQMLYDAPAGSVMKNGEQQPIVLTSSKKEAFDLWHLQNDLTNLGDQQVKLSVLGNIEKKRSGNNITKEFQQYTLSVVYEFVGSYDLSGSIQRRVIEDFAERLPLGYSVGSKSYDASKAVSKQFLLILLVITIIFFICAILFESLIQPFAIILLIPISYIGVFLTFYLFSFQFDQGGFAAFILLAGIVVNAGIYIINEYNHQTRVKGGEGLQAYMKAFHRKIVPIMLTILSTVLGLVPFVIGYRESFWFTFATGTMGGMLFSLVAIFFFLPLFVPMKNRSLHKPSQHPSQGPSQHPSQGPSQNPSLNFSSSKPVGILLLLCLLVSACQNQPASLSSPNAETEEVIPFEESSDSLRASEWIRALEWIPLQTTPQSLVGWGMHFVCLDSFIIAEDPVQAKASLLFNRNGQFITALGREGKGPGEYQELRSSIPLFEEAKCYILTHKKLLEYRIPEGPFTKEIPLSFDAQRGILSPCGNYLYFTGARDSNLLIIASAQGQFIKGYLPMEPRDNYFCTVLYNAFMVTDSAVMYVRSHDNTIYEIKGDSLRPRRRFDFGPSTLTEERVSEAAKASQKDSKVFKEKLKPYQRIEHYYENSRYILAVYLKNQKEPFLYFRDKAKGVTGKWYRWENFLPDEPLLRNIVCPYFTSNGADMVQCTDYKSLAELAQKTANPKLRSDIETLIRETPLTEESNPIVMRMELQ